MKSSKSKPVYLTKSKYISGLKCRKWLWLAFNAPEELPEPDASGQRVMDEGSRIGKIAQAHSRFESGIAAAKEGDGFFEAIDNSWALLSKRVPLFEPGFVFGKCYARADILEPVSGGESENEWNLIEVKSGTSVKSEHLEDVAFQKYVYEGAGLRIKNCYVMHLNNQYVKKGEIDVDELFVLSDVTEDVNEMVLDVPEKVKELFKVIGMQKCPEHEPGKYLCDDAYGVHKEDEIYKKHPTCDIFDLTGGMSKVLDLFHQGVLHMKDIPAECELNSKQEIQKKCHMNAEMYKDVKSLTTFMKKLKHPLYFMDFETIASGIPMFNGTRPYQVIPFQFSVHLVEGEDAKPKHFSFIAELGEDPRKAFISELRKVIDEKGTVVVYNKTFEGGVLRELGEIYPEHKGFVDGVIERFADLMAPFKNFACYHPKQRGSASMKNVLPALADVGYEDLEVQEGTTASNLYKDMTMSAENISEDDKKREFEKLEKYCGRDTEGMVWILEKLKKEVGMK